MHACMLQRKSRGHLYCDRSIDTVSKNSIFIDRSIDLCIPSIDSAIDHVQFSDASLPAALKAEHRRHAQKSNAYINRRHMHLN